ncbi:neocarzinostatin apoprotein domain-containing protein [Actinocorallia sp. A-T 12471]|uniref:neocarzinostatin apoprotein domain-containing protein n=1 Tax=Actinocorallia sp. A-T 12471 TaxID=3089813 RepID=UPI0029CB1385|nr:neocarzinostatin apoprotein domain-containing protein [Actinocorallia sp. A-T 12471]MDX6744357.1 neocarzinostatin apoprotein domain-containing protein [Actinocorallia sp. A-T 12471]
MRSIPLLALVAALALPGPVLAAEPAKLTVSATEGLTDGQTITVEGSGFKPGLTGIAVGPCIEGYTNGLNHCDLDHGAKFVSADDKGNLPKVTLELHPQFKEYDCLKQQCVIGAAPLPDAVPSSVLKANTVNVPLMFEGATFTPTEAALPGASDAAASDPDGVAGPSVPLWAVTFLALVAVTVVAARNQSLRRIK